MKIIFFLFLLLFHVTSIEQIQAQDKISNQTVQSVLGNPQSQKFSLHNPNYFIAGDDDLKLQFSFKYRLSRRIPFYFAYSQLMLWDIYNESKPIKDVNFKPEIFYRLLSSESDTLKTLDMGIFHNSNGKLGFESRSLNRIFFRANYFTNYKKHDIDANLMIFKTYSKDDFNSDIVKYSGYWELLIYFSNLITNEEQSLNLEFKINAGEEVFDFHNGSYQVGLIYNFHSPSFNPSIYLQYFEGYNESLISYNQKSSEYRLGLLLTF